MKLKTYVLTVSRVFPKTHPRAGELTTWDGPHIPAISWSDAEAYCQENGLGYCKVIGILIAEIPTKADGLTPDWGVMVEFDLDKN